MKFATPAVLALLVSFAAAATIPDSAEPETSPYVSEVNLARDLLEERAQCSGQRKSTDVCTGSKRDKKRNSAHNWYDCQHTLCSD